MNQKEVSHFAFITGELIGMLSRYKHDSEALTWLKDRGYDEKSLNSLEAKLKKLAEVFYR